MDPETFEIDATINVRDNSGPALDASASRFSAFEEHIRRAEAMVQRFSSMHMLPVEVGINDRATSAIQHIYQQAQRLSGVGSTFIVGAQDRASSTINSVQQRLSSLTQAPHVVTIDTHTTQTTSAAVSGGATAATLSRVSEAQSASPLPQRFSRADLGAPDAISAYQAQVRDFEARIHGIPASAGSVFSSIAARASATWSAIGERAGALGQFIISPFTSAATAVRGIFSAIDDRITGSVTSLMSRVTGLAAAGSRSLLNTVASLPTALRTGAALAQASVGVAVGAVTSIGTAAGSAIMGALSSVSSGLPTIGRGISSFVSGAAGMIGGIMSSVGGAVSGAVSSAASGISRAVGSIGSGISRGLGGVLGAITSPLGLIAGVATSAAVLTGAVAQPLMLASNLEQAQIGFSTFIQREQAARGNMIDFAQSTGMANTYLEKLRDFANYTPYEFPQVQQAARNFMAVGVSSEAILPLLTAMGNATSGLGLSGEALERFSLSLMQMRARGRVTGEELREMSRLGVPALEILTEGWKKLHPEIVQNTSDMQRAIEAGIVPARTSMMILEEGLNKMFPNMMERQSHTLQGLGSTIQDVFNNRILLSWGQGLASAVQPRLETLVGWLNTNDKTIRQWENGLRSLSGSFGDFIMSGVEGVVRVIGGALASDEFLNAPTFMAKLGVLAGRVKDALFGGGEGGAAGQGLFGGAVAWIKDRATELKDLAGTFITTQWGNFTTMVATKFDDFKTGAIQKWDDFSKWIMGWIQPAWANFQTFIGQKFDQFLDIVDEGLSAIFPWRKRTRGGGAGGDGGDGTLQGAGYDMADPATTMQANEQAINRAVSLLGQRFVDLGGGLNATIGECERFIEVLFGVTGQFGSAREAGDRLMSAQAGGQRFSRMGAGTAPRGSLAFFDTGVPEGHVALSTGNGFLEMGPQGVASALPGSDRYNYLQAHMLGFGWSNFGTARGKPMGGEAESTLASSPFYQQIVAAAQSVSQDQTGANQLTGNQTYALDPTLFARQLYQESHFDPNAQSGAGARGIAQFMPATGGDVAKRMGVSSEQFWSDPNLQIRGAAMYMEQLLQHYHGNYQMALAAYNAGMGRVDAAGGELSQLPKETQDYVRAIAGGRGGGADTPAMDVSPVPTFGGGSGVTLQFGDVNVTVEEAQTPQETSDAVVNAFTAQLAAKLRQANLNTPPRSSGG